MEGLKPLFLSRIGAKIDFHGRKLVENEPAKSVLMTIPDRVQSSRQESPLPVKAALDRPSRGNFLATASKSG